jgi:hypothetical protein
LNPPCLIELQDSISKTTYGKSLSRLRRRTVR